MVKDEADEEGRDQTMSSPVGSTRTAYFELYVQLLGSYWKLLNLGSDLVRFMFFVFLF